MTSSTHPCTYTYSRHESRTRPHRDCFTAYSNSNQSRS